MSLEPRIIDSALAILKRMTPRWPRVLLQSSNAPSIGGAQSLLHCPSAPPPGFPNAVEVLGEQRVAALQAACTSDCLMRGPGFVIKPKGVFDTLSDQHPQAPSPTHRQLGPSG